MKLASPELVSVSVHRVDYKRRFAIGESFGGRRPTAEAREGHAFSAGACIAVAYAVAIQLCISTSGDPYRYAMFSPPVRATAAAAAGVVCGSAEVARRANLTNASTVNGTLDGNGTAIAEPEVNISKCEVADIISWAVRPFRS
jgi:hypothetical protein